MNELRGLWRGKRIDNGEWACGRFVPETNVIIICTLDAEEDTPDGYIYDYYRIDMSTAGECTGLRDRNGKLIFEGDILKRLNTKQTIIYTVDWCEECAMFVMPCITHEQSESDFTVFDGDDFEVIGNIYDNPELLES